MMGLGQHALMTIAVDLGLSPTHYAVALRNGERVVYEHGDQADAFADCGDVLDLMKGLVAQKFIWYEWWR